MKPIVSGLRTGKRSQALRMFRTFRLPLQSLLPQLGASESQRRSGFSIPTLFPSKCRISLHPNSQSKNSRVLDEANPFGSSPMGQTPRLTQVEPRFCPNIRSRCRASRNLKAGLAILTYDLDPFCHEKPGEFENFPQKITDFFPAIR